MRVERSSVGYGFLAFPISLLVLFPYNLIEKPLYFLQSLKLLARSKGIPILSTTEERIKENQKTEDIEKPRDGIP